MGEDPAATPTADSQRPFASPSASSEKAVLAPLTLSPGSRQAERSYCPTRGREAHPGRRRAARGHTMAEAEPDQNFLAASARVSLGASAGRMLRSPENLVTSAQPGASPIPTLAGREQPPLPFSAPRPMPLFTRSAYAPPTPHSPRVWPVGEVRSAPPELSRTSKARAGDRTNPVQRRGWGVAGGPGPGGTAKKSRNKTKQNARREMIRSPGRLFYLPGGIPSTWPVGTIGLPFSPPQLSALGRRRGGERDPLSLRLRLSRAWTSGEASLQHT